MRLRVRLGLGLGSVSIERGAYLVIRQVEDAQLRLESHGHERLEGAWHSKSVVGKSYKVGKC